MDWYLDKEQRVSRGHLHLNQFIRGSCFPSSAEAFIRLIEQGHGLLFEAEPSIAGRFRNSSEVAEFGAANLIWRGSPSERIRSEVADLWNRVVPKLSDRPGKEQACQVGAFFLERFFMIHPFVDGNGRVARTILRMLVRECGAFDLNQKMRLNAHDRRKYVRALNYGHIHADPVEFDARHKSTTPLCKHYAYLVPLTRVLREWIQDVTKDEDLAEAEPPLVPRLG